MELKGHYPPKTMTDYKTKIENPAIIQYLQCDEEATKQAQEQIAECAKKTSGWTKAVLRCIDGMMEDKKFKKMVRRINTTFNNPKHGYTFKEPKIVKCHRKAPALNCHENSRKAQLFLDDENFKIVKGYNITTSGEMKVMEAEIHSVVKHIPTGEYIDYTEDYMGLKEKVFIECDFHTEFHTFIGGMIGEVRPFDKINNITKTVYDKIDKCEYSHEHAYTGMIEVKDIELMDCFQKIEEQYPVEKLREMVLQYNHSMVFSQEQVDLYEKFIGKNLKDEIEKRGWKFTIRDYGSTRPLDFPKRNTPDIAGFDKIVLPNPKGGEALVFRRRDMGSSDFEELWRRMLNDMPNADILVCG